MEGRSVNCGTEDFRPSSWPVLSIRVDWGASALNTDHFSKRSLCTLLPDHTTHVDMEGQASSPPHDGEHPAGSSSPPLPFVNHSTMTLPNNLPPNVDDKPMVRQKRKRTSPEDQAVLEAYYARDPKPDKAARLDLMKQVSMGEKEVQVGCLLC